MGCGDSKEKVKEKKSNATDALEASHSTNDPQYENEKAAEGQDAPPSNAKDNNSDTSPYVGKEGTAAAAAAGRPHGVLDAADTPLNREALFPEDQNNQFGIRVGTDKYDSLKDREASLELHSLHDTLDDASEASFASAEFKTAVSAALTTASQGTNNLYSNNPPPPKGRAAASVFEDKDSWTEAQSAAFLTPLNNDDGASMVSAQPHGYDYYNNKNTSKRTSKAPSEVAGANPNKFGRRGSLTVTQVRNNSVTASMHGEIPPSPYTRVSSRGKNFPEADRESYEPYGADGEASFYSCRSLQTVTPPVSARGWALPPRRISPPRDGNNNGIAPSEAYSAAPAKSEDFYTAVETTSPTLVTAVRDNIAEDRSSPPAAPLETQIHADRVMTSSQPRSKQESRASSVATSQSHRNPNDSKNLSRQSSTGRSTTKSSSVSTNANRKGEKEPSVEVSRSTAPVSEDDERPQPSPRRPTAAYVNRNNDRDGSEVGTTSRTASEAGTQRSFKTAVSAQTKATTAANREESHVKTPSERSATRFAPASEATNPHTAVVREEEELSDIGTQRSFKTAVSAQTKATTAANREESRIKTPSERSVSRSVPASEATNPHTTVTDTNKEHTPAASTRKSSTRNSSVAGSSPSPAVVREEEELSDIGTQRSFKTAVSAQTKATTVANREESRAKTPSERSATRSVPASEATNPQTTTKGESTMNTPKTSKKSSIVALSPIPAPYSTLSEGNSTTTGHTTQSSRLPKRQGSVRQSVDRPSNVEGGDTPSEAATQRSFKTAVSAQTAATTAK